MAQFLSWSSADDFVSQWQKGKMLSIWTLALKTWEILCFRKIEIETCLIYVVFQLPGEAIELKNTWIRLIFYGERFLRPKIEAWNSQVNYKPFVGVHSSIKYLIMNFYYFSFSFLN